MIDTINFLSFWVSFGLYGVTYGLGTLWFRKDKNILCSRFVFDSAVVVVASLFFLHLKKEDYFFF